MWALKRQLTILFLFTFFLILGIFIFYQSFIKKEPTCFDGIKNGLEEGVDCGGVCTEVCKLKANRVNVLWSKTFEVSGGVSNVAALVENPNFNYKVIATYDLKTFDEKGLRVNDFSQTIELQPAEKRLIFIPAVKTGGAKISKTFIDIKQINSLIEAERKKTELTVISREIVNEDQQTRLSIKIKNLSLSPKRNIEIVAILSKKDGTILDVGRTFLEYLNKREEREVYITWQKEIDLTDLKTDIYLREVKF